VRRNSAEPTDGLHVAQRVDIGADVARLGRAAVRVAVILREQVHVVEDDAVDAQALIGELEGRVHDAPFVEQLAAVLKPSFEVARDN